MYVPVVPGEKGLVLQRIWVLVKLSIEQNKFSDLLIYPDLLELPDVILVNFIIGEIPKSKLFPVITIGWPPAAMLEVVRLIN